MSKNSLLATAAVCATTALLLAGCTGATNGGSDSPATDAPSGAAIPKPNVSCEVPEQNVDANPLDTSKLEGEITFMTQGLKGNFDEFIEGKIKEFEDAHPGTKINWTDSAGGEGDFDTMMVTQAGNCSMADVINVPSSTILALSKANLLLDYDVKAPGSGDHFVPGVWDVVKFGAGDSHTAYPWYFGPFVVTYNKDVFERAGLDPNKPPATMDEYFDYAKKIADSGSGDYAVYGNTSWYMTQQWRGMGVKMMNDDYSEFTFAQDPQALKWLTNMAELYKAGAVPKDSIIGDLDMSKAYSEGNLAFGTPNTGFLRNVAKNAPQIYEKTGVGGEALNDGIKPLFSGQFIAVSVTSQNSPLAVEFAKFMTSDESELDWARFGVESGKAPAIFPVTTKAAEEAGSIATEGDEVFKAAREISGKQAVEAEAFVPSFYITGKVQSELVNNVNQGIVGDVDPQTALDNAQAAMNKLLKNLNK